MRFLQRASWWPGQDDAAHLCMRWTRLCPTAGALSDSQGLCRAVPDSQRALRRVALGEGGAASLRELLATWRTQPPQGLQALAELGAGAFAAAYPAGCARRRRSSGSAQCGGTGGGGPGSSALCGGTGCGGPGSSGTSSCAGGDSGGGAGAGRECILRSSTSASKRASPALGDGADGTGPKRQCLQQLPQPPMPGSQGCSGEARSMRSTAPCRVTVSEVAEQASSQPIEQTELSAVFEVSIAVLVQSHRTAAAFERLQPVFYCCALHTPSVSTSK